VLAKKERDKTVSTTSIERVLIQFLIRIEKFLFFFFFRLMSLEGKKMKCSICCPKRLLLCKIHRNSTGYKNILLSSANIARIGQTTYFPLRVQSEDGDLQKETYEQLISKVRL
jgi:hypothetical protein